MSELTPCNYCSLKRIRERAKRDKLKVSLRQGWRNGIDVYIPRDLNKYIYEKYGNRENLDIIYNCLISD